MFHQLRTLYEANGSAEFVGKMREVLMDEKEAKFMAANFSLKAMAEATRFPMTNEEWQRYGEQPSTIRAESVDFTAFPVIAGEILAKGVFIPAYVTVPAQSDKCIGLEMTEKKNVVRVPGWTAMGSLVLRQPGDKYDEATTGEKYVEVKMLEENQNAGPWGRRISLKEEDILFDQTGLLKDFVRGLGIAAGELKEKEFFRRLSDASGWYCYYPAGTRTDPYSASTTADTDGMTPRYSLKTSHALADYTDIQASDAVLALAENEKGEPIDIIATHLIVPRTLSVKAKMARLQISQDKKKQGGVVPTAFLGGLTHDGAESFDIVSSPWLDKVSTSTWYWGAPRMGWVRNTIYPASFFALPLGPTDPEYRDNDTIFVGRARWWARSFVRDYRFVVQGEA